MRLVELSFIEQHFQPTIDSDKTKLNKTPP
jgi:hypothetical protein